MGQPKIQDLHGNPISALDTAHRAASYSAPDLREWNPNLSSADADLAGELNTLKARARDLSRNNGVARGALHTIKDNVVGTGLRLNARPDYEALGMDKEWADDWARKVESMFKLYADSFDIDAAREMNFTGLTRQVFLSQLEAGAGLGLVHWLPGRGRQYGTTIQLIDPDRVSNPLNQMDETLLRGGIKLNRYGEKLGFWIRKRHPGDGILMGNTMDDWEYVPTRTRFGRRKVIHVMDAERVGQTHGKPTLTPVMSEFKMLGHYQRTELQAAIVNSMIAAFVESSASSAELSEMFGESYEEYKDDRDRWNVKLEGGAIIPLHPGDRLQSFTPSRPATAFGDFVEASMRNIATGVGISYELLLKDFSKTNYSSARAALLEAWRTFKSQRQVLSAQWAQPVYELWLEEAVNRGLVDAPGFNDPNMRAAYTRARWIGPGRGWIDPVKEAQAANMRMESGISTLEDECAEQGKDWEDVVRQRQRERAFMEELGVPHPDTQAMMQVEPASDRETGPEGS